MAWEELHERTRRYRVSQAVLDMLHRDRKRVAECPPGQQSAFLNRVAYSWGKSVARGFLSAALAEGALVWGGMDMANAPGREPWTQDAVRQVVRAGIVAGARPV